MTSRNPSLCHVVAVAFVICLACAMVSSCERNRRTLSNVRETSVQSENHTLGRNPTAVKTETRMCLDEIVLSVQLTKTQMLADWGRPDAVRGFGVEYLVYRLDDGRWLWLLFASQSPQPLLKADVYDSASDTEGTTVFDGMNDTSLR